MPGLRSKRERARQEIWRGKATDPNVYVRMAALPKG